jgi:hypothetical protein
MLNTFIFQTDEYVVYRQARHENNSLLLGITSLQDESN